MALIFKKNVPCASVEPSVVGFMMYLLLDCDSFKSALPLSFELAVCFNASLFYIRLLLLTTSPRGSVQNRSLNRTPSHPRIQPQFGCYSDSDLIHQSSGPLTCNGFSFEDVLEMS